MNNPTKSYRIKVADFVGFIILATNTIYSGCIFGISVLF